MNKPPELTKVARDSNPGSYGIAGWDELEKWAAEHVEGFAFARRAFNDMATEDVLKMLLGMMIHKHAEGKSPVGKVHERNAQFFVNITGLGQDNKTGEKFRLCTHHERHHPLVVSEKTGRTYELQWNEICRLAIIEGINK